MASEALDQIDGFENPAVPNFDPLPLATTVQPLAQVFDTTTAATNGPNGSVDGGGVVDQAAAAVSAADRYASLNAWSAQNLGVPFAVPTVQTLLQRTTITVLGAFVGGYHGYKRSGGKPLAVLGYGLAGVIFPVVTLGVAAVQGYAKPRRR